MTKSRDIASAIPAPSTISSAELGYLDGVTSAIQTQMDAKTAKATLTTTGDIYYASSASTPARLGIGSSAQVLTVAGGVPSWATASSGGVKQVVTNTTSTSSSTTSGTYVDMSNLTATITPSSISSQILVFVYLGGYISQNTTSQKSASAEIAIVRTATQIYTQRFGIEDGLNATHVKYNYYLMTAMKLDSPATTSAITYKCQAQIASASQIDWNQPRLVLMEI